MLPTTAFEMPMLALAGISVAGTVTSGVQGAAPAALRGGHLVMAAAMLAMLLRPGLVVDAAAVIALLTAAGRVGRQISATPAAVPCLIDLLGMIVISGAMTLAAATGMRAPAGGSGAGGHVLVIVGAVGAGLWIAGGLWIRRRTPGPGRWEKGVSVASAIAMSAMLLGHV